MGNDFRIKHNLAGDHVHTIGADGDLRWSLLGHTHTTAEITDFNAAGDARWVNVTGDDMSGPLAFADGANVRFRNEAGGNQWALSAHGSVGNDDLIVYNFGDGTVPINIGATSGDITIEYRTVIYGAPGEDALALIQGVAGWSQTWYSHDTTQYLTFDIEGNADIGSNVPLRFLTNGSPRVQIGTAGNVQIAAPSAGTALQVNGLAGNTAINVNNVAGTSAITTFDGTCATYIYTNDTYGSVWGNSSNHPLQIRTNNAARIFVEADGKVGIGAIPTFNFDVEAYAMRIGVTGPGYIQYGKHATAANNWHLGSEGDGTFRLWNGVYGAGTEKFRVASDGTTTIYSDNGLALSGFSPQIEFFPSGGGGIARLSKPSTTRMDLYNAGNGFWTGYHFVAPDVITFGGTPYYPRASLYYAYTGTTNPTDLCFNIQVGNGSPAHAHSIALTSEGAGALLFRTGSGTERMRVDSNGSVGIGTTGPYVNARAHAVGLADWSSIGFLSQTQGAAFRAVHLTNTNQRSDWYVQSGGGAVIHAYDDNTSSYKSFEIIGDPLILSKGRIQFPASQNASSDANTLDDYEEGSWTPSTSTANLSVSVQNAKYVKIGKYVHANCYIAITNSGAAQPNWQITGLPFTAQPGSYYHGDLYYGGNSAGAMYNNYVEQNSTFAVLSYSVGVPNGTTYFMFAFHYPAAD